MKTCPRCHKPMLHERFTDVRGRGVAWFCLLCGEREETYTEMFSGAMTDTQLGELMQGPPRGRPPGRRI